MSNRKWLGVYRSKRFTAFGVNAQLDSQAVLPAMSEQKFLTRGFWVLFEPEESILHEDDSNSEHLMLHEVQNQLRV